VALFSDPAILAAVIAGLVFLVALKVAAFIAVRRVMRPKTPPPRDE
jgi:hypothetical protein